MAALFPHRKYVAWFDGKRGRWSRSCPIDLGFSLFRWDIKLSLSAHALLTFLGPLKKANVARPRGKWSVCFELNTLLTDCRAGMVRRTQTVYRPGRTPPCPTLVPLRQCANEGSITPCPHSPPPPAPKKTHTFSLRQGWKTETDSRHRVH